MKMKRCYWKKIVSDFCPLIYIASFLMYLIFSSLLFTYEKISLPYLSYIMVAFGFWGLFTYAINKIVNKVKFDLYDVFVFLLIVFGIIATIFAIDRSVSLVGFYYRNEGLLQLVSYYILFINCKNLSNDKHKKIIINIILISGLIQAVYGIFQFFNIKIPYIKIIKHRAYSTGFQINPNFFGSLMITCLSFSVSLFFFKKEIKSSIYYLILSSAFFIGLLTSGAMSAIFALFFLVIFILTFIIMLKCNWKSIVIKLLLIVVILFGGFLIFNDKNNNHLVYQVNKMKNEIHSVMKGNILDSFGTGRIYIWRETLKIVPDNIINGVGIDNFAYAFGETPLVDLKSGLYVDKAHNEYLQKLITEGIFSVLTYVLLLCIIFIKSLKKIIQGKNYMLTAIFLCFVSYSIQAFFNISVITVAPIYYIIMGILVSEIKGEKNEKN